jgi:C4-type Zn-finger protein
MGVLWRWRYDYTGQINGLHSFCPVANCDMQIYGVFGPYRGPYQPTTEYVCDRCGHRETVVGSQEQIEDRVTREIQRLLRTETWQHALAGR